MGDVRVQRMFSGVVGKSRKMPGITKKQQSKRQHTGRRRSWELLVRPDPPKTTNNEQMPRQAKRSKNNKRKQTTRNEKRKKQMQIHREGQGVRSGIGLRSFVVASFGATIGCEYCHYLFMPQNVSFSFSFGQGSQLAENWVTGACLGLQDRVMRFLSLSSSTTNAVESLKKKNLRNRNRN